MVSERVDGWTQEWVRQGYQLSLQEAWWTGWLAGWSVGWRIGRLSGQADMLRTLLQQRFGELPAEVEAGISAAGPEQIQQWFVRSIGADNLAGVFSGH